MKSLKYYINESTGIFKNAEKIVDIIVSKLFQEKNNIENNDDEYIYIDFDENSFKDIPNLFFKELTIAITNECQNLGMYMSVDKNDEQQIARWDPDKQQFNWIYIFVNKDEFIYYDEDTNEIAETLQHELHHAYQDWQKTKHKGVQLYNDIVKNLKEEGSIDYYLDKNEFEGFLNNICKYVGKLKSNNFNIQEIFKKLHQYNDYIIYSNYYKLSMNLKSKLNNKQRKIFKQYWTKLNNHIYTYITQNE